MAAEPPLTAKRAAREYLYYLRVFAVAMGILLAVGSLGAVLSHPELSLHELARRFLVGTIIMLVGTFAVAAVPVLVPRLWFWSWIRDKRKQDLSD